MLICWYISTILLSWQGSCKKQVVNAKEQAKEACHPFPERLSFKVIKGIWQGRLWFPSTVPPLWRAPSDTGRLYRTARSRSIGDTGAQLRPHSSGVLLNYKFLQPGLARSPRLGQSQRSESESDSDSGSIKDLKSIIGHGHNSLIYRNFIPHFFQVSNLRFKLAEHVKTQEAYGKCYPGPKSVWPRFAWIEAKKFSLNS